MAAAAAAAGCIRLASGGAQAALQLLHPGGQAPQGVGQQLGWGEAQAAPPLQAPHLRSTNKAGRWGAAGQAREWQAIGGPSGSARPVGRPAAGRPPGGHQLDSVQTAPVPRLSAAAPAG